VIHVGWREATHPDDQALMDAFICAPPFVTRHKRLENHPEPHAVEVQSLLRGLLKAASRNSRGLDWRYLVCVDEQGQVAAALVHRRAPDITSGRLPREVPVRLIVAAAVRLDLRGVSCRPDGERLSDQMIRIALTDARTDTIGGLVFAEVDPGNPRMQAVLMRNGFEGGGHTSAGYQLFAARLDSGPKQGDGGEP
jgi:hypothetical protein